jgi:hypothetical protein
VNGAGGARWLDPSRAMPIDRVERVGGGPQDGTPGQRDARALSEHVFRIRDLRRVFGDPEAFAAHCSCGWLGEQRTGRLADRVARRDGVAHVDAHRPAYGHRGGAG